MATNAPESPVDAVRDHLASIAPGGVGRLSRDQLGQSAAQFAATLDLLADLDKAGELRMGERVFGADGKSVVEIEIERLV